MARSNSTPFAPAWLRCVCCTFLMSMFLAALGLVAWCGWVGLIAVVPATTLALCGFYGLMNGHPPQRLPSFSSDVSKGQFASRFDPPANDDRRGGG